VVLWLLLLVVSLQCVQKCCEKFMNVSARTGMRFQVRGPTTVQLR
jgi:hypothetical protein